MKRHDRAAADMSWQVDANCRGVDPELFYPARGASTREAKAVCQGCVVREPCLAYALELIEKHGIWGGLSERERRQTRRDRGRSNDTTTTTEVAS